MHLLPLFLNLTGRAVLLVGAGRVAEGKLQQLLAAGARVRVVAPAVAPGIRASGVDLIEREFVPADLDGMWLVVAAASPDVNRKVAEAAEARRIFVNAVDDPANASAFLSGVVRRGGVTIAISTTGEAPALTALLREGLDAVLPADLEAWIAEARAQRAVWRQSQVPIDQRKPLLLRSLNRLYDRNSEFRNPNSKLDSSASALKRDFVAMTGRVSLVGAGPGDPGLLTRKAIACLRSADLVLYDALIDERILRYARRAQKFFVGKRAGRHAMTQPAIQALMIRAARRGRHVVRLKGGDPFVFGRGGEEALALKLAGIRFEIVPGVTSAVAVPAAAGIPVTHRGIASAFLVVSAHDEDAFASAVSQIRPNALTIVVLMGLARSVAVASRLIDRGWSRGTPAAVVVDGTRAQQQVWRGRLDDLASDRVDVRGGGAGTIVVGEVAALDLQPAVDAQELPADQKLPAIGGHHVSRG